MYSKAGLKKKKSGRQRKIRGGKVLKSVTDGKAIYETPKDRMKKVRSSVANFPYGGGAYPEVYPFKNALTLQGGPHGGALKLAGMGGAITLAGGALKLAGQGANFKKLGKAEQERVMMAILKLLHKRKQMGGLRIGALDLSMLPDIGSAISEALAPKTALGRFIRKNVLKMLFPTLTGDGAIQLPGGYGTKTGAAKNRYLTKMGASTNPWILHKNAVFRKYKGSNKTFSEINKIASATYNKPAKRGRGRPPKRRKRIDLY
jgi:hypothetical protein